MSAITVTGRNQIASALAEQHEILGQLNLSKRSITAKNYDSAIRQLIVWMQSNEYDLPDKNCLSEWRDDLIRNGYSTNSVNVKLSAIRTMLNATADNIPSMEAKMFLRDWAKVANPKAERIQDTIEEDYGRRFSQSSIQGFFDNLPPTNLKRARDRAMIALGLCGLRVSEISKLQVKDLSVKNKTGQIGIHVRSSKHNVTRIVVLDEWNSWALRLCDHYINHWLGGLLPDDRIFRGVKPLSKGYRSQGSSLSVRQIQAMFDPPTGYKMEFQGELVFPAFHDLRRTYALLCRRNGMSLQALALNLGHSSELVTERYVGRDVDWSERVPSWNITI